MLLRIRALIPIALLLLISWNLYHDDRSLSTKIVMNDEQEKTEINRMKPTMHLYYDENDVYVDDALFHLWNEAWIEAGFKTKILSFNDARIHPNYNLYNRLMNAAGICCLPRQTYLRHLAMATIPEGGFLSEAYIFPLHKLSNIPNQNIQKGILPNNGGLTIYDDIVGSILSGTKEEWDRLTTVLVQKLEKNVAVSLQKLKIQNPNVFYFDSHEMYDNFSMTNNICEKAEDKFIIRFHASDLIKYGFEEGSRSSLVGRWMKHYRDLCWREGRDKANVNLEALDMVPREYLTVPDEVKLIDASTVSEVSCDEVSCIIKNTCVGQNGVVKLFGSEKDVAENKAKLTNIVTQNVVCSGCKRNIDVERGTGVHGIMTKSATFSAGIHVNDCSSFIGDMVWPLVRLNLKFRAPEELQDQGLGYLFLEAQASPCDSIINTFIDQIIRFSSITQDICVQNLHLGTKHMNYMPYSFFLPLYDNFERDMRTMRYMFWKHYGVALKEKQPDILMDTILIVSGKRESQSIGIENIPAITNMIRTNFPSYKLSIISWEDYSMKQQVHIMARVKLMISLAGSTMNAFLFQDEATLFSYCQKGTPDLFDSSADGKLQYSNEIKLWFKHFDYGNYHEFCDSEDMALNGQNTVINVTKLNQRMQGYGF